MAGSANTVSGRTLLLTNTTGADLYYYNVSANTPPGLSALAVPTPDPLGPATGIRGLLRQGESATITLPVPSPADQFSGMRLYFSAEPLADSLELAGVQLPDPFNLDWNVPYTFWEYSYVLPNPPFVPGGLTLDLSLVNEWSYPLETGINGQSYGFAVGLDTVRMALATQPWFVPSKAGTPQQQGVGRPSDLIWKQEAISPLQGNRIVGPLSLWEALQNGPKPAQGWTKGFNAFSEAVPWNGLQLFGTGKPLSGPTNISGWNDNLPVIGNGYTQALDSAAIQNSVLPPGISLSGWKGFFTYPRENGYGEVNSLADSVPVSLTVHPLSSSQEDVIIGSSGVDALRGSSRDEVIHGGYGGDRMRGGSGADTFSYMAITDSVPVRGGRDCIRGFRPSTGDRIDLRAVDADETQAGQQGFHYIGSDPFSGVAGELRYGGRTVLQGDADGDGDADFEVLLRGCGPIGASSLLLL